MATRPAIFKWRQTEPALILCAVRWYLRYSLSLRDVEELLEERGVEADHTTVWRWVQRYYFKKLSSAHLVGGRLDDAQSPNRSGRIVAHSHRGLADHLKWLTDVYNPAIVQIEYVELSKLVEWRNGVSCRWFLTEHDVLISEDGAEAAHDSNEHAWVSRYDAVIACSEEDARLVQHDHVFTVPNGAALRDPYKPSPSRAPILFLGPFRYSPNLVGIQEFLRLCWMNLRQRVPRAELWILGGHDAPRIASQLEGFDQGGVRVIDYSEQPREWLDQCVLTINPVQNVRGSCLKVIESLAAGRVCVSTPHGARGYLNQGFESLVVTSTVGEFVEPIERLILDDDFRRSRERPSSEVLKPFSWEHAADLQAGIYDHFLGNDDSKWTTKGIVKLRKIYAIFRFARPTPGQRINKLAVVLGDENTNKLPKLTMPF